MSLKVLKATHTSKRTTNCRRVVRLAELRRGFCLSGYNLAPPHSGRGPLVCSEGYGA